ncbi:HD-GYP domain-containing protein [Cohnella candidum]|uniref:HD-GYP domain-containing protein n=1 Tax=Cohnella candidum TaxID=2674991 RepID=A0A3G3JY69_9BACL|nr:HD-GYP domain-containing protein [Cohnella candidum]AYQ73198.1 HD-GYP domain-containing protein [Cohnella candidum]
MKISAIDRAVARTEELFQIIRLKGQIPIMEIRADVLPLIQEATEDASVFPLLTALQTKNDYLYRHSVAVSAIATLIGRWMGLPDNESAMLTVGALLHNAGKMRIPEAILNKEGPLDQEEFDLLKKHTVIGYELLEKTVGLSKRSALIALQHHEREDGTGYPLRLPGSQIDPLSKITAVADVFHAITSHRVYRNAAPFHQMIGNIYNGSLGRFDYPIVHTFTKRLMNAMVGSEVTLTDSRRGRIVLVNPADPTVPLVQVGSEFIDLSREPEVNMVAVYG